MMKSCPKTTELWTISWHFYVFTKSNFRQVSAIYVKKRFFVFLPELKGCCWSETEPSCGRKIVIDSFGAICFVFGVGECCRRERKLPRHPSGWLSPRLHFFLDWYGYVESSPLDSPSEVAVSQCPCVWSGWTEMCSTVKCTVIPLSTARGGNCICC